MSGWGVSPAELRDVFRQAVLVLARSDALLADLEAHGCPRGKLRLQRTGVPLDFWAPPAEPRLLPPTDGAWQRSTAIVADAAPAQHLRPVVAED